jgi:hypothetical protein
VEGVAGQIRHPLAYENVAKALAKHGFGGEIEGVVRPGIDVIPICLELV